MEGNTQKIIFIILSTFIIVAGCNKTNDEPYRLSDGDKALLSSGDIIMRRGEGMLSTMIINGINDSTGVSHCGVIVRDGDSINVIHCLSDEVSDVDGVQLCSLDDFVADGVRGTIAVVRCRYDSLGHLASGARYYLTTGKEFDLQFDAKDTTRFFCSEMPVRILYDRVGIDIIGKERQYNFKMFFNPSYFDTIFIDKITY